MPRPRFSPIFVCLPRAVRTAGAVPGGGWSKGPLHQNHSLPPRSAPQQSAIYTHQSLCLCEFLLHHSSLCAAGKKLLGRSQVRSVAEKRRDKLNDYCKVYIHCMLQSGLFSMYSSISHGLRCITAKFDTVTCVCVCVCVSIRHWFDLFQRYQTMFLSIISLRFVWRTSRTPGRHCLPPLSNSLSPTMCVCVCVQ